LEPRQGRFSAEPAVVMYGLLLNVIRQQGVKCHSTQNQGSCMMAAMMVTRKLLPDSLISQGELAEEMCARQ
jgi:hypothetical protein